MGIFDKIKKSPVEDAPKKTTELSGDRNDIHVFTHHQKKRKHLIFIGSVILFGAGVLSIFGVYYFKKPPDIVYKPKLAEEEQYQRKIKTSQEIIDFKRNQTRNENQTLDEVKKEIEKKEEKENKEIESVKMPDNQNIITLDRNEIVKTGDEKIVTPTERKRQGEILLTAKEITANKQENNKTQSTNAVDSKDFLKGIRYQDGLASFVHNRPFLLSAGTIMPCVLKTKIITNYPSIVLCQLTKNVYSDDGKNILIRAGALLQGEQTRVLSKGIARVFVNWSTVKDGNVRVQIDALGADGLGASGLPGWIDNHFWERFGSAMLLSFIDDALAAAASHASKENTSLSIDNTRSAAKSMAELALENSIDIPPTAYINQGEMLSVIVPRNIDFSTVYQNK